MAKTLRIDGRKLTLRNVINTTNVWIDLEDTSDLIYIRMTNIYGETVTFSIPDSGPAPCSLTNLYRLAVYHGLESCKLESLTERFVSDGCFYAVG